MIIALTRRDPLPLVRFAQALHLPQAGPLSTQIATGVLHSAVQLVEDCRRAKVHCGQIELSLSQVTMGCPGPNRTIAHLLIPNSSSGTMYNSLLESLLNTDTGLHQVPVSVHKSIFHPSVKYANSTV